MIIRLLILLCLMSSMSESATVTYTPPAPPDWQSTAGGHIAQTTGFFVSVTPDRVSFTGGSYDLKVFGGTYDATGDLLVEQIGTHQTVQPIVSGNIINYPSAEVFDNGTASWKFWTKNDGFGKELIFDGTAGNVIDASYDCLLLGGYSFEATGELRFYSSAEDATGTPLIKGDIVDAWRIGWVDGAGKMTQYFDTPFAYGVNDFLGVPAKTIYTDNGIFYLFENWQDKVRFDPTVSYTESAAYSCIWTNAGHANNTTLVQGTNLITGFIAGYAAPGFVSFLAIDYKTILGTGTGIVSISSVIFQASVTYQVPEYISAANSYWYLSPTAWDRTTLNWNNMPTLSSSFKASPNNALTSIEFTEASFLTYATNCANGIDDWKKGIGLKITAGLSATSYAILANSSGGNYARVIITYSPNPQSIRDNAVPITTDYSRYFKFWRDTDYLWTRFTKSATIFTVTTTITNPNCLYHGYITPNSLVASVTATEVTSQANTDTYVFKSAIPTALKDNLFFATSASTEMSINNQILPWQSIMNNTVDNVSATSGSATVDTSAIASAVLTLIAPRIASATADIASASASLGLKSDTLITNVGTANTNVTNASNSLGLKITTNGTAISTANTSITNASASHDLKLASIIVDLGIANANILGASSSLGFKLNNIVVDFSETYNRIDDATTIMLNALSSLELIKDITQWIEEMQGWAAE